MENTIAAEGSDQGSVPTSAKMRQLSALRRLALLDSTAEAAFERATRLVTNILNVPMALVILVHDDRLYVKSAIGLPEAWASGEETGLTSSLYPQAIEGSSLLIESVREHPTFKHALPIPGLDDFAYAGIPLLTAAGLSLGSICAIDHSPRQWTEGDRAVLTDLAVMLTTEIELRATALVAGRQARRVAGLQHVTESLSAVLTPAEAARVVLEQGANVLGADAGLVGLLSDEGTEFRIIAAIGHHAQDFAVQFMG
jgi:GAF domain-containing protein